MAYAATLLNGRCVLDEPIGAGGSCEAWRTTDTVLTRPVTVKLLHADYALQPEAQARLRTRPGVPAWAFRPGRLQGWPSISATPLA